MAWPIQGSDPNTGFAGPQKAVHPPIRFQWLTVSLMVRPSGSLRELIRVYTSAGFIYLIGHYCDT